MPNLPNTLHCFVCGVKNDAGLKVRFETDGDRVFTRFITDEEHVGYPGIAHGGVLASLLDETMGWAPVLRHKRFCVCVELNVEFKLSVPVGVEVIVSGWVTSERKRIWETEGDIRDAEGTLYAKGRARYLPVSLEKSRDVMKCLLFDEGCVPPNRICEP